MNQKIQELQVNNFENSILKIVSEKDLTYVDAVLEYCAENEIEPEYIKNIMTDPIKDKLEMEYQSLNLLPKEKNKLEFDI